MGGLVGWNGDGVSRGWSGWVGRAGLVWGGVGMGWDMEIWGGVGWGVGMYWMESFFRSGGAV